MKAKNIPTVGSSESVDADNANKVPKAGHKPHPNPVRELEVREAFNVTPLTRRVVLTGDQLGAFRDNGYDVEPFHTGSADDHITLVSLGTESPETPGAPEARETPGRSRDYTPRRYDPETRRLEVDFVRHGGGPAAEWAERAAPGQRVHLTGPHGTTVLPEGIDWYFLVGDETALPALARRIEELPAGTPVTAVVSVPSASAEQTFAHSTDLHLTWLHRDNPRDAGPEALMDAVRAAPWRDGQVYVWAAGEAGMLRPLRRWLKQPGKDSSGGTGRAVDPGFTGIAAYWRAGQTQQEAGEQLDRLRHMADLSVPHVVRAAITLDLAEHVEDGHRTVAALAEAADVTQGGLRRLLRVLAHEGLFTLGAPDGDLDGDSDLDGDRDGGETVALTPAGAILTEDNVHRRLDRRDGYSRLDDAWPGLLHTLRTGTSGFEHEKGHDFWAELASEERLGRTFDESLSHWLAIWSPKAVQELALTDEHVVDIGGGTGALLGRILTAYPQTTGTLLDLPTTAERARAELAELGLTDRVRIAAQSFFERLPAEADLYLLAQVLHDWPDAEVVAILRRVAEVAGESRVVLVERIIGEHDDANDLIFDLQMHTVFASGERTERDWSALADQSGLRLTGTTQVRESLFLIELRTA